MKPRPLSNPPNPYLNTQVDYLGEPPSVAVTYYEDHTREIIATNDSPDIGFSHSVNPYRGCVHACNYCFARRTHEYLGFGAGTDFDTRIAAKLHAPELLRAAFDKPSWKGDTLFFSGVTDCYQPLEASLRLTRGCLEVCAEYRNPVAIVTKSPLIERDLDVLRSLHERARVSVAISIPFWNKVHARAIEPWVATPERRVEAIRRLSTAGIEVGVLIAPIIPGLGDEDIPKILRASKGAGAHWAGHGVVRLPGPVAEVFEERLRAALPERADKVMNRIRELHHGKLNDPGFGERMRGHGHYAEAISALFRAAANKVGFVPREHRDWTEREEPPSPFRRPLKKGAQLSLFADD
jgi:DNA repair photolyase